VLWERRELIDSLEDGTLSTEVELRMIRDFMPMVLDLEGGKVTFNGLG